MSVQRKHGLHVLLHDALGRNLPQLAGTPPTRTYAHLAVLRSRHQKGLLERIEGEG